MKINAVIIGTISLWTHGVFSTSKRRPYDVPRLYTVIDFETTSCVYGGRFNFDFINFYPTNRRIFNPLVPPKTSFSGSTKTEHQALMS